jgi:methionine-rich copper-binding protein CopC
MPTFASVLVCLALMLCPAVMLAHSTLQATAPASGSVLSRSPREVLIIFNDPARLISVAVTTADGSRRTARFSPAGKATVFAVSQPKLEAGRNEVTWSALSADGHPVHGTIILIVRPGAVTEAQAQPDSMSHGRH